MTRGRLMRFIGERDGRIGEMVVWKWFGLRAAHHSALLLTMLFEAPPAEGSMLLSLDCGSELPR